MADLDLVSALIYLAPGFLAVKLVDLFGAQHRRSQWEWTIWSVIVSAPIALLASVILWTVDPTTSRTMAIPDGWQIALALALGLVAGIVGASVLRHLRGSRWRLARWLRREMSDSAWDRVLEDATMHGRAVEVVTDKGDRYSGKVQYAGRETAGMAGWLYLHKPDRYKDGKWSRYEGTDGLLVNRENLPVIRVYQSVEEASSEHPTDPMSGT